MPVGISCLINVSLPNPLCLSHCLCHSSCSLDPECIFVPCLAAVDLLVRDFFLPLYSCEESATLKSPSPLSVTCIIADKLICYAENYRAKLNVIHALELSVGKH